MWREKRKNRGRRRCRWFSPRFLWYLGRMKIRIQHKLFLAMLAVAGAVVLCMYLVMRWSFDRGFLRYAHTLDQERLETVAGRFEEAYAAEGSWRFLKDDPPRLRQLLWPAPADRRGETSAAGPPAKDCPPGTMPRMRGRRGMGEGMGPMQDGPRMFGPDPGGGIRPQGRAARRVEGPRLRPAGTTERVGFEAAHAPGKDGGLPGDVAPEERFR